MKRNTSTIINKNGFSLLEITVVLIIISILLSAVIPVLSRIYLEKAANKTALDISTIEEACRKFYIDHNQWPVATGVYGTPMAALQAGGYLPSTWSAINPFTNYEPDLLDFTYHILVSANAASLTVYTNVPANAQPIIENLLPASSVDPVGVGHNVYSTVSVPGSSSTMPTGTILAWPTAVTPAGFLLCDGTIYNVSSYPGLAAVLGSSYGGDGSTTFGVPDLRDQVIVGVDTKVNGSYKGLIPQFVTGGTDPTQIVGATFGEPMHTLSVNEIPPLTFSITQYYTNYDLAGWTHGLRGDSWGGYGTTQVNTNTLGGGAAHNIVQPSTAMGYIIKT